MKVEFSITHQISSSKGWGRYRASANGEKVVESATGNEWVSAPHSGEVEPGTEIAACLQTMTRVGKMRKERVDSYDYRLVATPGAVATLGFWCGLEVVVIGAELIA